MRADALVVLGCRIAPSGRPGHAAARRVAAAVRAFQDGVAPRILASGGRRWGGHVEATALCRAMVDAGVPTDAVLAELWSLSTLENAIFSAALLRRMGAHRAAIVTCCWHMERAMANFRAVGIDAVPVPANDSPMPRGLLLYRHARERVCRLLDAHAVRRAEGLRDVLDRGVLDCGKMTTS